MLYHNTLLIHHRFATPTGMLTYRFGSLYGTVVVWVSGSLFIPLLCTVLKHLTFTYFVYMPLLSRTPHSRRPSTPPSLCLYVHPRSPLSFVPNVRVFASFSGITFNGSRTRSLLCTAALCGIQLSTV
ncbi:hypothetical protein FA13DRAFT_1087372 [Coprinellus micaceus]|uniref:Uncharacterized protein n=1 Tax=Coprinellus micaceus TaxID=71717 RepID=A0A4Y7TRM9_COPMI|nr:hypothetical protein FA13DRAFT_1087372 [Coprinellus micaceus]